MNVCVVIHISSGVVSDVHLFLKCESAAKKEEEIRASTDYRECSDDIVHFCGVAINDILKCERCGAENTTVAETQIGNRTENLCDRCHASFAGEV